MDEYERRELPCLSLPFIKGHKDIFEAEVS
jgi:hypothetical protein